MVIADYKVKPWVNFYLIVLDVGPENIFQHIIKPEAIILHVHYKHVIISSESKGMFFFYFPLLCHLSRTKQVHVRWMQKKNAHALPWHWSEMCVFKPSLVMKGQLWSIYDQSARQPSQPFFHLQLSWWISGSSWSPFWGLWRAVRASRWRITLLRCPATLQRRKLLLRWLWISSTHSTRTATSTPWTKLKTSMLLIR